MLTKVFCPIKNIVHDMSLRRCMDLKNDLMIPRDLCLKLFQKSLIDLCLVCIIVLNKDKLTAQAIKCIFIEYPSHQKVKNVLILRVAKFCSLPIPPIPLVSFLVHLLLHIVSPMVLLFPLSNFTDRTLIKTINLLFFKK